MKKLFLIICCSLICSSTAIAGIDLPWSTTYNCPDWNTYNDPLNCDGLLKWGGQYLICNPQGNQYEQITLAANNPNGGGGKGERHWVGDGSNSNTGGLQLDFNTIQPEFWIRWYARWQPGFKWTAIGYEKLLYIWGSNPAVIPEPVGWDGFHIALLGKGVPPSVACNSGCGWDTWHANGALDPLTGHRTADGSWHCLEVHLRMDTNGSNGVLEFWLDGVKKISANNVPLGTTAGWTNFVLGSNQSSPNNGGCAYVDYDDIVISNTGYIGPLAGGPKPYPPSAPPKAPQ